jgi:hypothetical protein
VPGIDERLQRGNGELRGAAEDQFHRRTGYATRNGWRLLRVLLDRKLEVGLQIDVVAVALQYSTVLRR